ncbi:MAG: 4Fe-4S dicluster domain-containing protein, partial [Anaerolineales bacterium]|nr:4Fe-4S dicluster domain-containing protein [Anaerolineales bacterium]
MTQNYGFLIDQSKCIGCHACSTACKSENQVPLGVYRTWVKYVETGSFPDVRRRFQVTRCNHCANPPCVRICPVSAMYQRADGIVEFDPSICIGCKSCMQACPYDSIYLDPETNTAAKCHFCAHRLDVGLEPACVVVCPEHAILAGDLNDPASEIARTLASAPATVRKPEQGTAPKLFYINGNDWSLHPSATQTHDSYMWADKVTEQNVAAYALPVLQPTLAPALENADYAEGARNRRSLAPSGTPIRA